MTSPSPRRLIPTNELRALPSPQLDASFAAYTDMFRHIRALPARSPIAALVAVGVINACAELQRWAPSVNADNAADICLRPVFCGLFCD